jgi:hypothetical protein
LDIACETYGDADGWTSVANVGSYIKRVRSDFNSKNFGYTKLTDLIAHLSIFYELKKENKDNKGTTVAYMKRVLERKS